MAVRIVWWRIHRPNDRDAPSMMDVTGDSFMAKPRDGQWPVPDTDSGEPVPPALFRRILHWAGEDKDSANPRP